MNAYETVQLARDKKRPTAKAYTKELLANIVELHGDRAFGDDKAVVGGIGELNGMPVTFIAVEKGSDLKEARKKAYEATEWVSFDNKYMRHDIGKAIDEA